jgi:hypothetical protein
MKSSRSPGVFLPILLAIAVVPMVAAVVATRPRGVSGAGPDLHWVIGAPPPGLATDGLYDSLKNWTMFEYIGDETRYRMALYGTQDDPSSPSILLGVHFGMGSLEISGADPGNDHGVGCSTDQVGTQRCTLSLDHGTVLESHSHGLTRPEISTLMRSATMVGGNPRLPSKVLPAGMRLLKVRSELSDGPISAPYVGGLHGATIGYLGAGDSQHAPHVSLTVTPAAEQDLAEVTLVPFTRRSVDGVDYFVYAAPTVPLTWVTWQHDGKDFYMVCVRVTLEDALSMARSVRLATPAEWAAVRKYTV